MFIEVAEKFLSNEKVLRSIRRYEGRDLVSFGTWTSPDGYEHVGASKNTIAYREISAFLRSLTGLPEGKTRRTARQDSTYAERKSSPEEKAQGCAIFVIVGFPLIGFMGYQTISYIVG